MISNNYNNSGIVHGAIAIGKVIGEPNRRRVYYLLENDFIPGARRLTPRRWMLNIAVWRRFVDGEDK